VQHQKTITKMILKLMLQAALVVLAVFIVAMDSTLAEQGRSEYSMTEYAQELCIFVAAILFGLASRYDTRARGFFVLVMGLFATMLIRESDALFDNIQHGFWIYPALFVSIVTIFYARKCKGTVKKPMLDYMDTKSFAYITLGLIIILIFSRIFGSGFLWREIMGDDYSTVYKSVMQEGIELLGYVFVLYGSIMVWTEARQKSRLHH